MSNFAIQPLPMKLYIALLLAAALLLPQTLHAQTGAVGIGTTSPAASAALDITSSDRGLLLPRLTTAEIASIPSPQEGLLVYNKSRFQFWGYQRYDSVVAQHPTSNTGFPLTMSGPIVGQSFTVPVATLLTGVELELTNHSALADQSIKVDLFNGTGYAGTLLGSDTVSVPVGSGTALYLFSFPETIVAPNSTFSLRINCYTCGQQPNHATASIEFPSNSTDPYPGGQRLNASGAPFSGPPADFRFHAHGFVVGWRALQIVESD